MCRLFEIFKKKQSIPKGNWEVKKAKNGQWYFVLKAPNNKVLLMSEMYNNKQGAFNGIESVRRNANSKIKEV